MLDWVYYLGLAPPRFGELSGLEQYFAMARGTDDIQLALDMSKYFDTNYREPYSSSSFIAKFCVYGICQQRRFPSWRWTCPNCCDTKHPEFGC